MIKVLVTDLDGTLFYPKKPRKLICQKNKELAKDFVAQGGRVVVATSRTEAIKGKIQERLGVPFDFIGADGTIIEIDGKKVRDEVFLIEESKTMLSELRQKYDPGLILLATRNYPNVMTRTRVSHFTNFLYFAYEAFQGIYREPFVRSDAVFYSELNKGDVHKLMALIGLTKKKQLLAEKITVELAERYPDFEFSWLNQFIEITPKGCSKASAVSFYLDYLGINHDNVLVVGDSGNDVGMFEAFYENSYCMAHAKDSVKSKAAHVVPHVYDLRPVLCPSVDSTPTEKEG